MKYRLAGIFGGLMLVAGQFVSELAILQLVALLPLMVLILKDHRPRHSAMAGMYMGLTYIIPQMIYLRMPVVVTLILLIYITLLLVLLCWLASLLLIRSVVLGSLAVGGMWFILDWFNFTAVPIWGMAQSLARSWTGYPPLIGFISLTGICGVLFVIGSLQGLTAWGIAHRQSRKKAALTGLVIVAVCTLLNISINAEDPTGSLRVAAIGWTFSDASDDPLNPNSPDGFETLFATPAQKAADEGAKIISTGELGFYFAGNDQDEWMKKFTRLAKKNHVWLIIGYFNISADENRLFFMSPDGKVEHQYTKTYLTPLEQGQKGNGDLKLVEVDGFTIGAMICQDDNFSRLTRAYGKEKVDIVFAPTADWHTIRNAHLQSVRARAIECRYGIVRAAANGISAAISPAGELLNKWDHFQKGPGYIVADIPRYRRTTLFSLFGFWPGLTGSAILLCLSTSRKKRIGNY